MTKWMSGIRGSILIVVLWVIGWGLGFGGIMEAFVDPDGRIEDVWPVVLAIPGCIGGVIFALILAVAERGQTFDQISLPRFVLWGLVTGAIIGLLSIPAEVGDVSPGAAGMIGIATVLGVISAVGSWIFFQLIARGTKST